RFERRAGQLELSTRLEADRLLALRQADDVIALHHGGPAETLHALEHGADAGMPRIGKRLPGREFVNELLVFGADAPLRARLSALGDVAHEIVARPDRSARGLGDRHGRP